MKDSLKTKEILSGSHLSGEEDNSIRPLFLNDFIGQEKIKSNLDIFIRASKNRKEQIDHILFYGPPGLGKTTLAKIIANEMGVNFKSTSGPAITKSGDLAAILTNLEENDILFIDEIHRLSIAVEEILYSAMEDFAIDIIIGEGPSARTIKIDLPKFTLVGATTRFGMLSSPLRTRFGILCNLEFYSSGELSEVVLRSGRVMSIKINEPSAEEIARRARGTPRIALRLLRRVRDFASVLSLEKQINLENTKEALNRLEVDSIGLDKGDINYLTFIAERYNGGPVGIETIAAGISEERDSIEDIIEPYLIQIGFIVKTPRGRCLTKNSLQHLNFTFNSLADSLL
jgi:Holliday junction DNA helicase RuvB